MVGHQSALYLTPERFPTIKLKACLKMILSGCLFEMLFTFKVARDKHSDTMTAFQDKRK